MYCLSEGVVPRAARNMSSFISFVTFIVATQYVKQIHAAVGKAKLVIAIQVILEFEPPTVRILEPSSVFFIPDRYIIRYIFVVLADLAAF